jgi:hypothetical protein
MVSMSKGEQTTRIAEKYATDFIRELHLDAEVEQKCEWTCLLWSKDHWSMQARKSQISLQQTKERLTVSRDNAKNLEILFSNSQFLNTVAQVYSRLFDSANQSCAVKIFSSCPFMGQRQQLLNRGSLASVFVTILHKATLYAMLERHPIDSGLLNEEYNDVYGVDLTSYQDLEASLMDGRFAKLFDAVLAKASQLAGLPQKTFY